ncbi:MAG: xanthine dehydrogenase accessory protein XdhC [Casimicrobium sp.]
MHSIIDALLKRLKANTQCVLLLVSSAKGSAPREVGASMIVTANETFGTIGGGHLELKATEHAREMLKANATIATQRHFPLGPALGQCCGGAVSILFAPINETHRDEIEKIAAIEEQGGSYDFTRVTDTHETITVPLEFSAWHIVVFGAGHVGKAIVEVCSTLPCRITWIDEREAEFPKHVAANVRIVNSDSPADEVKRIHAGAQVLVLTHSHALDLDICFALLKRDDLAYCGLIGSATKAATFRNRFAQRGHSPSEISRIICPIGRREIRDKHPGAIAVSVAFDLAERWYQRNSENAHFAGARIDLKSFSKK